MAINIDGDGLIALGGTASTQGRLRLAEDTDNGTNFIELTAPASVGSDRTITFPDATTTVVGTDTTQTLTNKTIQGGAITSGTSVASTSGTSIDFTGIPAYAKRITVMFSGVSTNGTSIVQVQLGDAGGVETTGYTSGIGGVANAAATSYSTSTSGFACTVGIAAANTSSGLITVDLIGSNIYTYNSIVSSTSNINSIGGGTKTLSDTLTRVRITTVNGTDTFDAGSINILFE